jgi:hypothetical protein
MLCGAISRKERLEYFDYKHEIHLNIHLLRECIEDLFIAKEDCDISSKMRTYYRKYKWNKYLLSKLSHSNKYPFI